MILRSLILIWAIVYRCQCLEREMTINIEPGTRDCFYEHAKVDEIIDIEYQVIDGGHGDLDTSFELSDPTGRILYADFKKSDNIHRHKVKSEGDYRFCFDNSFSMMNRKTVFFEMIIENENGDPEDVWGKDAFEGLTAEEFYDMKVEDIQNIITKVRQQLQKARQAQDLLRSFEARDRNIAEENNFRVSAWSFFQVCMMIVVGGLQVFMVRSLFDNDSKVSRVLKKIPYAS